MISTEGHVKVADFGLARLTDPKAEQMGQTMTGTVMGTPDYMAPEQMKGMNVDHRADIYSLGVMLYEMLCREVPKGIFEPPSHRTGCDVRLDQIVIRAMQQKPDRRYQTTAELKADVTAARTPLAIVPITPTQVVHPHPVAKPALPAPQAAVMKAIAPPASAKSKLPLYVGIAVVVLAVVVLAVVVLAVVGGAVFLAKSKPKTLAAPKSDNATPAAPEPGAIKLWDAPDKFTPSARVRWENNAVRLDGQGLREKVPVRDLALRATVLLNSDAVNSQIQVRSLRPTQGKRDGRFYSLGPSGDLKSLVLAVTIEGTGKPLKTWPLPRPPGPDQWLPLELRIVGDELTASADGRVLGTVRDSTVTDAGDVVILSNAAAGYFRNIVYVPLDKPASAVASTSGTRDAPTVSATNVPAASAPRLSVSTEPWVNAMDNPELRKLTEAAGASLRFDDKGANVSLTGILKDGAVRMLFSFTDKSKAYACEVKARRAKKGDYSLHLSGVDNRTALHITRDESGKGLRSLGRFVLPGGKPWPAERPVELELRVVGTTLVGKLNGVELGRVEDGALTEGQLAIRLETGAVLHAVETLDLSKAEPTVPLAAGTASSAPPTADGWISLLPLIDPPRDKVEGDWKIVNGELQGGDSSFARLALPYSPPDEYDFRIRFTRESGNLAVSQHLASAGKDVMWLMGGFGNKSGGFEEVGGEKANANPTTIKTGLENGRRYESVVKVRRDRVQVEVDGKQVADYQTDWSDFSMNPKWTFPDPKKLGVGCQQATIFHSIEVLPVKASPPAASSDGGKPVASATPSPAPASPPQSATAKWLAEQEPQWQAAFAGEVSGPFEKGVADLKKQYLAALETQLAVVTKAAKLDDAVAFRDERARFTAGIEMPAEDEALMPASLTTLRASYRTTFAKLDKERFAKAKSVHARYDAILAQNLALLTQRQLFDEALEIKTKRDALSLAWLKPPAEPLRTNIAPQKPGAVALPEGAAPGVPIDKLPNLKTLQELEISAITPRDIMALKDAKKLRVLRVRGGGITDDDVRGIISVVPGLQDVSLGEWNAPASITNACVPALLGLKLPRSLDLCSKGIDDAALPTVAKMRTLLSLKLGGSSVSSSGLGALVALEALTSLDLHNTRIGDSGLEEIAKFKSLRTLDLSETNVSNAAVDKLKKALPRLQVTGVGKGK